LRSLPSVFPPHFFTSSDIPAGLDDDSGVYNAFYHCHPPCDDSAEYNGVTRLGGGGVGNDRYPPFLHLLPEFQSYLPTSASDPTTFAE
jgi:hypothetical protein